MRGGVEIRHPHLAKKLHRLDVAICLVMAAVITVLRLVVAAKGLRDAMVGMSTKMKVRQPNFGHGVGISIALPYAHSFVPTPNLSPLEIAYSKGADAARRGIGEDANPYNAAEHRNLSETFARGYKDNAAPKSDPPRRLKSGSEPGDDQLDPTGDEGVVS